MATNTNTSEDRSISECKNFGGVAEECAEIAERLDEELTDALSEIETLLEKLSELESEIAENNG